MSGSPGSYPLVRVLVAMSAGICIDRWWAVPWQHSLAIAGFACCGWCFCWRRERSHVSSLWLLTAVAATGASWHYLCWRIVRDDDIGRVAADCSVFVEAIVTGAPRWIPAPPSDPLNPSPAGERFQMELELRRIQREGKWQTASGRVRVSGAGTVDGVVAGDRVSLRGRLATIGPPRNPDEFPFAEVERFQRRFAQLYLRHPHTLRVLERRSPGNLLARLQDLRGRGVQLLWQHLHRHRAGLAAALLLGTREQIDAARSERFLVTGTVHLLAISGQNVAIVIYGLWLVLTLGIVRRGPGLLAIAIFALLYALLTDSQPPVMRAAVLASVMCLAKATGRSGLQFNSLAAAGIVVLMLNPCSLFQTGAQLSFLAVGVLVYYRRWLSQPLLPDDPLDRLLATSRPWWQRVVTTVGWLLWRGALTTLLITLLSLPLVWQRFHLLSPVIVLVNPLVMPPIAVAMFSGFGVFLFGDLVPPLARLSGLLCDASLACVEFCLSLGQRLPANHGWFPAPPVWWTLSFYAVLALILSVPRLRPPSRWCLAAGLVWLTLGLHLAVRSAPSSQVACTFMAVGDGTSVLIELPDGRRMLYDAGRLGSPQSGQRIISNVLWSRGITHLDAVVISHGDLDHFNALPELLKRFSVGTVYVSPTMFAHEPLPPPLAALREALEQAALPVRVLFAGAGASFPGGSLQFLHPPEFGLPGSNNANSLVLELEFAGRRLLLPGDLEPPGLDGLLGRKPRRYDVLMAPHHGSAGSQPYRFAAWSQPQWVIASTGPRRDLRPLRRAFESSGARVLSTSERGAVRVTIDKTGIEVRSWSDSPWE